MASEISVNRDKLLPLITTPAYATGKVVISSASFETIALLSNENPLFTSSPE